MVDTQVLPARAPPTACSHARRPHLHSTQSTGKPTRVSVWDRHIAKACGAMVTYRLHQPLPADTGPLVPAPLRIESHAQPDQCMAAAGPSPAPAALSHHRAADTASLEHIPWDVSL